MTSDQDIMDELKRLCHSRHVRNDLALKFLHLTDQRIGEVCDLCANGGVWFPSKEEEKLAKYLRQLAKEAIRTRGKV
jgi:hypothetical protein